jgi:hypothetical protein
MLYISHQQLQELMTSRPVVQEAELGYNLYHSTFESIIDEAILQRQHQKYQD